MPSNPGKTASPRNAVQGSGRSVIESLVPPNTTFAANSRPEGREGRSRRSRRPVGPNTNLTASPRPEGREGSLAGPNITLSATPRSEGREGSLVAPNSTRTAMLRPEGREDNLLGPNTTVTAIPRSEGREGSLVGPNTTFTALSRPDGREGSLARPSTPPPPSTGHTRLQERREGDTGNAQKPRSNTEMTRPGSEAVNMDGLAFFVSAGASGRMNPPLGTPNRKRQRIHGDRFIPSRSGQDLLSSYSLLHEEGSPATPSRQKKRTPHGELHFQRIEEANRTYSAVLRNELFEDTVPQPPLPDGHNHNYAMRVHDSARSRTPPAAIRPPMSSVFTPTTPHKNLFSYLSPQQASDLAGHPTPNRTPASRRGPTLDTNSDLYSLSPIRFRSQQILLSPRPQVRAVAKMPYKVLDAPDLADDFYLNLVDWGSANVLGVGLASSVYLWNANTSRVSKLCTLDNDTVTSVSWIQKGTHIAVGTGQGKVQIWDAEYSRRLRTMEGHQARVGALAWNSHVLTSGSRDRLIYHRDVRASEHWMKQLVGHRQEVCGLKWNCEDGTLASGGNDNKLMVWDQLSVTPLWKFSDHTAAVKAIAWSPHQRATLASGGGTADRRIVFHDTMRGTVTKEVDTGSQVCNIAWSNNTNEIVTTHGYSQNQIVVWKYPSMTQITSLTGHTYRVLYLAMSPDGRTVVTGAGDETLRFWTVFGRKEGIRVDSDGGGGSLSDWSIIR